MERNVGSCMSSDTALVKQEPLWEQVSDSHGVSEAVAPADKYTDQEVKELVLGLDGLQSSEAVLTANAHVKEEVVKCLKEEAEWEDQALSGLADLYAGHEVKDELVLGPEGLQPADIAFTLYAAQALNIKEKPVLDCVVRLERIDLEQLSTDMHWTVLTGHIENKYKGNEIHRNINTKEETYVCDICKERFALKTQLMAHVVVHIHQSSQERMHVADNARASDVREQPALRDCPGRRARGVGRPGAAGRDQRATHTEHTSGVETEIHRNTKNHADRTSGAKKERQNTNISANSGYSCGICKKRFIQRSQLMEHVMIHIHLSLEEERMRADYATVPSAACCVRLQRCDEREGPASHARGRRDCLTTNTCGQTEDTESPQDISTNNFVDATEKNVYICDICGKTFMQKCDLIRHIQVHRLVAKKQKKTRLPIRKHHATENNWLSCEYCNKQFAYLSILITHRRMHTGEKPCVCKICKKGFATSWNLRNHSRIHTGEKPFSCRICGKRFRVSSGLRLHEAIHSAQSKYSCKTCGKGFGDMTRVKVHERTHTGEKPYSCKICNKKFSQSSGLKAHERRHTGEKRYFCGICKQGFTQLAHMTTHERIHSGVKPYSCNTCEKAFTRLDHLRQHVRTHTGERPYECGICKKTFSISGNLSKHKRLHTGDKLHSCQICKKKFALRTNLKKHERVHTGEKPYLCGLCERSFALKDTLNKHMVTHTKEKPFSCGTCGRAFGQRGALRVHARTHASLGPAQIGNAKPIILP